MVAANQDDPITKADLLALKTQIECLENSVFHNGLQALVNANTEVLKANAHLLERVLILLDGDDTLGVTGLRKRTLTIEEVVAQYQRDRDRLKWIAVALAVSGIGQLGLLGSILSKLFGG